MTNIERLYYNMDILVDDWTDLPETKKAGEALCSALGKKEFARCEDEIYGLASANEKQGFIYGFQYAASLLMDGSARSGHMGGRMQDVIE